MSRSPSDEKTYAAVVDRRSPYRRFLAQLDQMLEDGESWSGNERNCAFLNLGSDDSRQVRFATTSAVTGLNFLDDGRAHALVDWDQDGDMDIWTTNRTAPRLRLMRNDASNNNHYLALRLIGTSCNRDAIGARVEVIPSAGQARGPWQQSLRAGEGFLAQSSKWLHFGLGTTAAVDAVVVHWPGAPSQTVRGIEVDGFYEITQGNPNAKRRSVSATRGTQLAAATFTPPELSDAARILLSSRLPLPRLPYQEFDGTEAQVNRTGGQAIWLNLWASWCVPCLEEMQEATARAEELRAAGLNVLALSLDGFEQPGAEPTSVADAQRIVQRLQFPFEAAAATPETIRRLQFADRQVFGRQSEMVLPTSFLLTPDGQLAAIYRGPVSVDQLLADAGHLQDDAPTLLAAALPFPGLWFDGRRRIVPLTIVADLLDHQAVDDAFEYLRRHRQDLAHQPGYPEVVGVLGTMLAGGDRMPAALETYGWALEADPDNVAVLNNLAWHLATHPDAELRDPQQAIRHAEAAARVTRNQSAAILDTLATSYAAAGETDRARSTWDRAIELAKQQGQTALVERLRAKRGER